ncbi:hypothetical protein ANANG_G00226300, partial [Anguilla anguilla]
SPELKGEHTGRGGEKESLGQDGRGVNTSASELCPGQLTGLISPGTALCTGANQDQAGSSAESWTSPLVSASRSLVKTYILCPEERWQRIRADCVSARMRL